MNKTARTKTITFLCVLMYLGLMMNAQAQTYLEGRAAYIRGDYQAAYEILRPLADGGDADAQKMMGIMYDYGQGVEADPKAALDWFMRSAEQGQTAVQYQVGAKFFKGGSVPRDYNEAAKWWQLAADGGQVDAQFNLGLMYFRGLGVSQDDRIAADMFERAAEQDHGHAQYSLGVMYAFGRGVDRDYSQAREWFLRSADKGIAQAQYNLGIFYENGNGVEADMTKAREWYQRAAAQGLNEAIEKLASIDIPDDPGTMQSIITTDGEDNIEQAVSAVTSGYDYSEIATTGIRRESWLLAQRPEQYTIQIGSINNEEDLLNYIRRHQLEDNAAYIEVIINDVTRYNAFYGIFDSYQEAEQAISGLPGEIQRANPWIRNIGILQKMIK